MLKINLWFVLLLCSLPFSNLFGEPKVSADQAVKLPAKIESPQETSKLLENREPPQNNLKQSAKKNSLKITPTPETRPAPQELEPIETAVPKQVGANSDMLSKEIELRKLMLDWSRHLGVTCNFCHNTNNFKSDEKSTFKTGLKHKSLVRLLNEEVFTERDKGGTLKIVADCYMCHRGYSTPQFKEPPQNLMK
jgi:hypothetical protein